MTIQVAKCLRPRLLPLQREHQLERLAWRQRSPAQEKLIHSGSNFGQLSLRQLAMPSQSLCAGESRREFIELVGRADRTTRLIRGEGRDQIFHFDRFIRQGPTRTLPGCFLDVPSLRDEAVETVPKTELSFDGIVSEIVERKERRVFVDLSLPRGGALRANAFPDGAAISSLGEFQSQSALPWLALVRLFFIRHN